MSTEGIGLEDGLPIEERIGLCGVWFGCLLRHARERAESKEQGSKGLLIMMDRGIDSVVSYR